MTRRISALLCALFTTIPQLLSQEPVQPIERDNLLKAVSGRGIPEQRMVELVELHKLNFIMTANDADEMRKLGAGEALIAALWKNDKFEVKPGPPLTKDGIVTLLQSDVPPARVERIVELRKAKITLDGVARGEIMTAGGTPSLLGIILTNSVEAPPLPPKVIEPPKPVGPTPEEIARKYADTMAQAEKLMKTSDYRRATELAEDAKKLDLTKPQAFSFAGYVWLYARNHIPTARAEYADAIDRGGTVEFRVKHSDGVSRITRRHSTCLGRMYVSKTNVRFRADNGRDVIEFSDNQIKEIDRGGLGPLGGGVVVQIDRGDGKPKKETFFSARDDDEKAEEELIIDIIKK